MANLFCDNFRIINLKIHEFMGAKGELFIDFSDTTEIIGDNGKGKSLILNAIAFLLCGTDAFGKKIDFSVFDTNTKESFSYVEAKVLMDKEEVLLKRTYKVDKKGSTSMQIRKDHAEINQTSWNKICNRNIVLSMINPKYLSTLKSEDMKNYLLDFLKIGEGINEHDILMSLDIEDIENLEDLLSDGNDIDEIANETEEELKSITKQIKTLSDKIKELEKLERPKDVDKGYFINALFFNNEEDAFDYIIDAMMSDPTPETFDLMKEFNELKVKKEIERHKITEYENKVKEIPILNDSILKLKEEKKQLEGILTSIDNFNNKLIEKINLDKYVNDIKIQYKNSLGKKDFKIVYKDAPLETCSYSEQVLCGIKLTDFLMSKLKIDFPIFVDNAECITTFPTLTKPRQLVSMSVAKGFELSKYVDDKIVNLRTYKTMPKVDKESLIVKRLIGGRFDVAE